MGSERVWRKVIFLACCVLIVCVASPLRADPPSKEIEQARAEEAKEAGGEEHVEKVEEEPPSLHKTLLDRRYRFHKQWQSELGLLGGDYIGDAWLNTWDVGARYYLHLNNTFAIGAAYLYSPIRADSTSTFGQSLRTKHTHLIDGELRISNEAAFRAGDSIIECDLYLTLGGGAIYINRVWKPLALIGGGIKVYTPAPWFAVTFDVNSYLHPTPKPGGSSFNADMVINAGVAFLFPVRRVEVQE